MGLPGSHTTGKAVIVVLEWEGCQSRLDDAIIFLSDISIGFKHKHVVNTVN